MATFSARLHEMCGLAMLMAPLSAQNLPEQNRWQFWARDASAGKAVPDSAERHAGSPVTRIEHTGPHDWAWSPDLIIPVTPGDLLEIQADLKIEGPGDAGPCFIVRSADGAALEWLAGYQQEGAGDWRTVKARVLAAGPAATVQPRIIGNGPATVGIANVRVTSKGNVLSGRDTLPPQLIISNETIQVSFDTRAATFTFHDKRNGVDYVQRPAESRLVVTRASTNHHSLGIDLLDPVDERTLEMRAELISGTAEVVITLTSTGPMSAPLRYPGPIQTVPGQYLVIPMNEGISYPVEDPAMPRWNLIAYGGHGICMPFFGATDGTNGWMAILESPDDAGVQLGRGDDLNWVSPTWDSQHGAFGYTRSIRYMLLDAGGHVAMAKRYRQHAKDSGLLKTFNEKMRERPQLDKLLGAVNVWCWDNNAAPIVKDMLDAGIDRILWSHRLDPDQLDQLNELGVLTSRYDIYQDLMDPSHFPKIRYTHPDWTTEGFPRDIVLNRQGQPIRGWEIEVKGSREMIPCAVLCDLRAPDYALKRIGNELQSHPYQCRFIDTTTATPWRECYHPGHPMTRTQSRIAKMKLLALVSDHFKLVCGSETGQDAAVPYCDYFEGMLSLGPYRIDDAGRAMQRIHAEVPERVLKFQVGENYRLPLWELVYHDCCVAQWYWGDYNNKLPAIWDKRDLFNALYATPPMFMFTAEMWRDQKQRFVQSYQASAAITRATARSEMTDHRFLTANRSVQETTFANGVTVRVNFGDQPFNLGDTELAPGAISILGLKR